MIRKDKADPMDREIKNYFEELHKDIDFPADDLPDIQMASWEEIEELADKMVVSEAAEASVEGSHVKPVKVTSGRRKKLTVAFLAATLGTLLVAGVANGDRLFRFVVGQGWVDGQNELSVDSNKVLLDRERAYDEAVKTILVETGVQSIQQMDPSWGLREYEIEGKYSYLTFEKGETEVLVKQRDYSGADVTLLNVSDKEYLDDEKNELIKELVYEIYSEEIYDGSRSYETRFVFGDALYIVQAKCSEEEFRGFIKNIYIKRNMN